MSTNAPRSGAVAIPAVAAAMLYCKPNFKPVRSEAERKDDSAEPPPVADPGATAPRLAAANRR